MKLERVVPRYQIAEIFGPTLQGEGFFSGTPALFLRLAGCNFECAFCDTDHKVTKEMTVDEILIELLKLSGGIKHLVITGGEPALQLNSFLLTALKKNFYIQVETNGSVAFNRDVEQEIDFITLSPKTTAWQVRITRFHELKLLYPFLKEVYETLDSFFKSDRYLQHVYVMPIDDSDYQENLKGAIEIVKKMNRYRMYQMDIKLCLQTQKILKIK